MPATCFIALIWAAEPTRLEGDYAKWHLAEPALNFAISARCGEIGVDHLGFQVDSDEELVELKARAQAADLSMLDEGQVACCYARSDKYWLTDPDGVAWEQFHTLDSIPTFSDAKKAGAAEAAACCASDTPRGKPIGIPVTAASSSSC